MTCTDVSALATEYLEGALNDRRRIEFESHVTACVACSEDLRDLRLAIAAMGRLRTPPSESPSAERILETYRAWKKRTRPPEA